MTAVCRLRRPGLRAHILHALRLLFARKPEEEAVRQTANAQAARMLDAYGNSILRLAYSYLHNQSDAEEVLQDTLLQFLRTAPVLESPQHEKAWLLRVAANLSKNRLKYNRLRSADELRDTLAAEQREDLSFVWEAVKALPGLPSTFSIMRAAPPPRSRPSWAGKSPPSVPICAEAAFS